MSKYLFSIFWLIVVISVSGGCASQPPAVNNLNPTQRADRIIINETISYKTEKIGLMGWPWQIGLLPGTYISEKENELGIFYRGEGRPVWARRDIEEEGPLHLYTGGIWIPKGPGEPRLYSYYEAAMHTAKSLREYQQQVQNASNTGLDGLVNSYIDNAALTGKPIAQTTVGAVLGAAIVTAAIQADVGKINLFDEQWAPREPQFFAQLRKFIGASRDLQPSQNSSTQATTP